MTIQIEICEGFVKGKYHLRIGDIQGASESSNLSMEEVLEEIKEEMNSNKIVIQ